jgi:hypothetical protein
MAILSGRQAEEWIAQNPGAAYNSYGGGELQKMKRSDKGFFGNILSSVTQPFENLGRGMNEMYAQKVAGDDYKPLFMSKEERDNPLEFGAKNLAGAASFFIPVGGAANLAGKVGRGAVAGGLSSFGAQDMGEFNVGEIGTGALFGGGATGALSKLSSKFGKQAEPSKLFTNLDDSITSSKPGFLGKLGKKFSGVGDDLDNAGFRRSAGGVAPKGLGGAPFEKKVAQFAQKNKYTVNSADDLLGVANDVLSKNEGTVSRYAEELTNQGVKMGGKMDDIVSTLTDEVSKVRSTQIKKPMQNALDNILTDLSNAKTPQDLLALKREFGELAKFSNAPGAKAFEKNVAGLYQKAYMKANDALDDVFKANGIKNFKDINKDMSFGLKMKAWAQHNLAKDRPGAGFNDMAQDSAMAAMIASGGNPLMALPGFVAGKAMQSPGADKAVGKLLQRVGGGMQNAGRRIPMPAGVSQKLTQVGEKIAPIANKPVVQQAVPSLLGKLSAGGSTSPQGTGQFSDMPGDLTFEQFQQLQGGGEPQENVQDLRREMMSQLVGEGVDIKEAIAYAEAYYPEEEGAEEDKEAKTLRDGIDKLEQLYGAGTDQSLGVGTTTGFGGILDSLNQRVKKGFDQGFNDRMREYQQMQSIVLGVVNQARGAGTLNEGEFKTMMQQMPNEYTRDEVAQEWFRNIREVLQIQ